MATKKTSTTPSQLPVVKDIKKEVVTFLLTDLKNCDLTVDKAFDKFTKTVGQTRKPAFKTYYDMCINGQISLSDLSTKEERVKIDPKSIIIKHFNPGTDKLAKNVFEPFKTGKAIDRLFSLEGGVMPGTSIVIPGEPGVGKSTVSYDIVAEIKKNYPNVKTCVIQSEMKKIDLEYEFHKGGKPWMKNVDFIVLKDYQYENADSVLERIFTSGYHLIVVDSIEDVMAKLKDYCDMTSGRAENFLLSLFDSANEGKDNNNVMSAIMAIQQMTKGGEFVGSNKLAHNTTGMLYLKKDEHGNRYAMFRKNRRNGGFVGSKMFYSLGKEGNVMWDESAFDEILQQKENLKNAQFALVEGAKNFTNIFAKANTETAQNNFNGSLTDEIEEKVSEEDNED